MPFSVCSILYMIDLIWQLFYFYIRQIFSENPADAFSLRSYFLSNEEAARLGSLFAFSSRFSKLYIIYYLTTRSFPS